MSDDKYTCARDGCDAQLFDFCPEHWTPEPEAPEPMPVQLPPNPCPVCKLEMGRSRRCPRCRDRARGERTAADMVNKPPHYDLGIEPIVVIEAWGLGFCLGNAVKYIARAEHKGTLIQDLQKARWYLDREIEYRKSLEVAQQVEPVPAGIPNPAPLCTCTGPARDKHDPRCPVRLAHPREGDPGYEPPECGYVGCSNPIERDGSCTDCLLGRTPRHR